MRLGTKTMGSGPDLVLLHGWGMNSAVWTDLVGELDGYRLTLIDLPGHGGSEGIPAGEFSLNAWVAPCLAYAPEKAAWLGWSLGGQMALRAAVLAPERVDALLIVAGSPRFVQAADWTQAMDRGTFDQFKNGLAGDEAGTLERFLYLQVQGGDRPRETLRRLRAILDYRPRPDAESLRQGLDLLKRTDLRPALSELRIPNLWLLGGSDSLVPRGLENELKAISSRTSTKVIPGAGHAPFLSHTQACADAIRSFMGRVYD